MTPAGAGGPRPAQQRLPTWLRYVLVGGGATLAHYALLAALVELAGWAPPWAAGAGAALGAQVGFIGNRSFTFGHQGAWLPAWWRFQLTALLGGLTSIAVVAAGVALGLHYLLAQGAATLLVLVLTYLINRRWAFG